MRTIHHRQWSYWTPPAEHKARHHEAELADTLREVLLASLRDRCQQQKIGLALSGGLDSRLIASVVPEDKARTAFTMCDRVNREAKTAKRVAEAYGWSWTPLFRHKEYLANHLVDIVKFVGCECEFVHAHLHGFANTIAEEVDVLLTGDFVDTLLRAYTAFDFGYRRRLGGLLPPRYEPIPFDYVTWTTRCLG